MSLKSDLADEVQAVPDQVHQVVDEVWGRETGQSEYRRVLTHRRTVVEGPL